MRTVSLARMAKRGSWPIAGGTLNQTQYFMDYCQAVWADEARAQHGPTSEEMEE
jgi:hypothetical protein